MLGDDLMCLRLLGMKVSIQVPSLNEQLTLSNNMEVDDLLTLTFILKIDVLVICISPTSQFLPPAKQSASVSLCPSSVCLSSFAFAGAKCIPLNTGFVLSSSLKELFEASVVRLFES